MAEYILVQNQKCCYTTGDTCNVLLEKSYAMLLRKMGKTEQAIFLEAHVQEFPGKTTILTQN